MSSRSRCRSRWSPTRAAAVSSTASSPVSRCSTSANVGPHARRLGAELGRFMAALHTLPAGDLAGVVPLDDTPLAAWSAEARRLFDDVRSWVPPEHRPAVADFLAGAPPPAPRRHVLAHN